MVAGQDTLRRTPEEYPLRRLAAALVVVLAFTGVGCTPQEAYIAADRATYELIGPAYLAYVRGDAGLDADQVQRRERLIDSWRIRIEQAEGSGGER